MTRAMRSAEDMLALIVSTAQQDDRIRATIMNGSRVDPNARGDIFQDFDVVYLVTDVASFAADDSWIDRFGEIMIMQMPEAMGEPPPKGDGRVVYLMQFADGNRIDLTLFPMAQLGDLQRESLSLLLEDKDGAVEPFPPPTDSDHLPRPPTGRGFADCCNEFWWVSTYVAKGLWREEIVYAKFMLDQVVRPQLMKMVTWYVGAQTQFSRNPGKFGKRLRECLEPELWTMLENTYSDARYESTWDALSAMADLFRVTGPAVAEHFGFGYPHGDDQRVTAHLERVRRLPGDASAMY